MLSSFSLDVIDPCNRTGKISVPTTYVVETRGVVDHQRNPQVRDVKDLSLCLLFQKGRCNAGARCHQVHADPAFVDRLRLEAALTRNCCAAHGDIHSCGYTQVAQDVHVVDVSGRHEVFAAAAFARTTLMDTCMRRASLCGCSTPITVPAGKICRLHAQGRCKFGKDCKNIHLCPGAAPKPCAVGTHAPKLAPPAIGAISAAQESCGLSNGSDSGRASAAGDSPLERTMAPLSFSDVHAVSLADSGFSFFSQPLRSLKASSPQFDASGFELELSLVQRDLCGRMSASSPTGWKP